jgi:hypothetical protein
MRRGRVEYKACYFIKLVRPRASVNLGHFFEGYASGENEKSFVLPKCGRSLKSSVFDEMKGSSIQT